MINKTFCTESLSMTFSQFCFHVFSQVDCVQMEVLGSLFHNDGSLVLANNERIHIPDNVRFYWEVSG